MTTTAPPTAPGVSPKTSPSDAPTGKERSNGTRILASLAVLVLAGGVFTVSSLALFTDQETVGNNLFNTGSVDLRADDVGTNNPATVVVTKTAMAPGDQVTAPLEIENAGTMEFRYSMTSTTTEDTLASTLVLSIKAGVSTCDDANWQTDGTLLYQGQLGDALTANILGDPTQGGQAGDRVLAASAIENLCFNVTLPNDATGVEGLSTTATFTFDAEQTANNA